MVLGQWALAAYVLRMCASEQDDVDVVGWCMVCGRLLSTCLNVCSCMRVHLGEDGCR